MSRTLLALLVAAALPLACSSKKDETAQAAASKPKDAGGIDAQLGTSGRHRAQESSDWVPAEFKKGGAKWKDAGVYVDGKPLALLFFGEMPRGLKPFWKEDDEKGDPETQRFRIADYLEALGVDLSKVKELHIYGGGLHVLVVSGKDLLAYRDGLHFRFGRGTSGKPLLGIPAGMKLNTLFDKIQGLAVYIDKKPPKLNQDDLLEMDGKPVEGVPYFGEPLRGGVRVYKDDHLALHLKRNKLKESEDIASVVDGELRWKLAPFLAKYGVDLADVVVAEVIRDDKRSEQLSKADLEAATFTAMPQASGAIVLGDGTVVHALALYTKPLPVAKAP